MGCSASGLHKSLQFSFVMISTTYEINEKIDKAEKAKKIPDKKKK